MLSNWLLLPDVSADMPFQMALDEVIFRETITRRRVNLSSTPILRFFYSSEPWTTVGYSYQGSIVPGEKICRRMTGGGKVSHGEDLIMSLIAHKSADETFASVRVSYWKIHEAIKKGFEILGHQLRFYRADEKLPTGGDCFLFPITTDLAYGKQKVAGGSQKRSEGFFLHQESIQKGDAYINLQDLKLAIQQGFENVFTMKLQEQDMESDWLKSAKKLAQEKYSNELYTAKGGSL